MNSQIFSKPGSNQLLSPIPRLFRIGFWVCIAIAILVALHRIFAPLFPTRNVTDVVQLDQDFIIHRALTLFHVIPALAFVLLVPFVISPLKPNSQRTAQLFERILFVIGIVVGITAYAMTRYAVGGWIERSAVLFFNSLYLFCLIRAFAQQESRRAWLLRAVAILLGIATTRPVMGVFFATSRLTHLTLQQFFGIAFWIGFSINTVAMELWIRSQKRSFRNSWLNPNR